MNDYRFIFTRRLSIVVEAESQEAAWAQAAQLDPNLLSEPWTIELAGSVKDEQPVDQGPVEVDDWGDPEDDSWTRDDLFG
jgi:hypothetical protein